MISLLDRYMSLHYVPLTSFQLLGMSCLLVSCKYEDRFVPSHNELINMADEAFSSKQLTNMEKSLLESLNYNLSLPLPSHFLRRLARASCCDAEMYTLAKFFLEISTLDSKLVTYKPSLLAASAFCLARSLALESEKLIDWLPGSKYSLDQLRPCATGIAKVMTIIGTLGCKVSGIQLRKNGYLNSDHAVLFGYLQICSYSNSECLVLYKMSYEKCANLRKNDGQSVNCS